ncbi:MAG: hypothetical protein HYV95_08945 [Opitutae bacterium]|nr:hypothetical protein [Opitutae bacterium]
MRQHDFFSVAGARAGGGKAARRLGWFAATCLLATGAAAKPLVPPEVAKRDTFTPLVQLAPFVVHGQQLAVSIHARSARDRRYAEDFAEEVLKVVYESVTESPGKGLVIIGKKGEPHPIFLFRKFLSLAEAGKLDPVIAARGPELFATLNHWQHQAEEGHAAGAKPDGPVDMEFEQIVTALPLPLEGVGAELYQLAWAENFDDARVEARLRALRPADLGHKLFTRFDWVFYLPPKGAFDRVLDGLIADGLKEDDSGLVARMAVKAALLVVKPKIRQAIESLRRGMMLATVAQARTPLDDAGGSALMQAYIEVTMPWEKEGDLSDHERAVRAVRKTMQQLQGKPPGGAGVAEAETPPAAAR